MPFLHNDPHQKNLRKNLRNNATPAEIFLWSHLRKSQFEGLKFRRQYGIGPYVTDFYCPELRLVVEVDGEIHLTTEAIVYDEQRTKFFNSQDIRVVRFSNQEVIGDIVNVLGRLKDWITENR